MLTFVWKSPKAHLNSGVHQNQKTLKPPAHLTNYLNLRDIMFQENMFLLLQTVLKPYFGYLEPTPV